MYNNIKYPIFVIISGPFNRNTVGGPGRFRGLAVMACRPTLRVKLGGQFPDKTNTQRSDGTTAAVYIKATHRSVY